MNTVGGMKEVKESDLWGMGIMAIGTAGMIALPYIYRGFKQAIVPKPLTAEEAAARARPVPGGAPGEITNVGPLDVLRASTIDVNLAVVRQAHKAMMNPGVVDTLEQMLRSGGYTQGQSLIDAGIKLGHLRTNTMEFKTPTPSTQLDEQFDSSRIRMAFGTWSCETSSSVSPRRKQLCRRQAIKRHQELGQQLTKAGKGINVIAVT